MAARATGGRTAERRKPMRRFASLIVVVLLAAVSCRQPRSVELFMPGATGPFEFSVDMSDTLSVYDFDFYTRLDGRHRDIESDVETPLTLVWEAPSGGLYVETVYISLAGSSATFYSRQVRVPYRSGVIPSEAGVWSLRASLPVSVPGLRGLGLIVRRRPWDTEN